MAMSGKKKSISTKVPSLFFPNFSFSFDSESDYQKSFKAISQKTKKNPRPMHLIG
jgi:hypothetical protein